MIKQSISRQRIQLTVTGEKYKEESREENALLLFMLDGEATLTVDGSVMQLRRDEIALVNPDQTWGYRAEDAVLLAQVPVLYEFISTSACGFRVYFIRKPVMTELRGIAANLLAVSRYNPANRKIYAYESEYFRLLQYLLDNCLDREALELYEKGDSRRDSIMEYIHLNYNRQISLGELAEHLYLSTGYLSRYFTKTFGTGFAQYLMKVRLRHVHDELLYSDKTITQISYDCGFTSISLFNRSFKHIYGLTPSEFRAKRAGAQMAEERGAEDESVRKQVAEYIEESRNVRTDESNRIVIRTQDINGSTASFWKMLNVGKASNLRSSTLQNHVKLLHEMADFQYVRFWGLFSRELFLGESEGRRMNFSRIDRIFDFILENGMKPFIDLEEKPERINQDIHRSVHYEDTDVLFENRDAWERTFARLLTHLCERYGPEEMSAWKFEVGQYRYYKLKLDNEAFFFEMFENVCRAAKTAVPGAEVGGCIGSEYFSVGQRMEVFLNHWSAREVKPDFFTMVIYGYDTDPVNQMRYTGQSRNPHAIRDLAERYREMLVWAGFDADRFVISEWNVTVSDRNLLNDTAFRGAYEVNTVLGMYGKCAGMGAYIASDQLVEHYDSSDVLFGGNGLVTKDGIPKPAAFAFSFLNQLFPRYIASDGRYIATSNGKNRVRILLHNLQMPNYRYYMGEEDSLGLRNLDDYFDAADSTVKEVALTDLVPGKYRIRIQRVNIAAGNVIRAWKEFGFVRNISYHDMDYLKRTIGPGMSLMEMAAEGKKIELEIRMEANEIALVFADYIG